MKKQQNIQQGDPEIMHRKNRGRLIEQNRQLYSEIFRLQHKVSALLTKNLTNEFKEKVNDEKLSQTHKELTLDQVLEIKRLKKKILLIKNSNKPQQQEDMRQALDQLTYLKKQRQKYQTQKQALTRKRKLKNQGLQLNKPIEQEHKRMIMLYKTAQRQNFDLKTKSMKIQRQIANLHKIRQLARSTVPKVLQNPDFQLKKCQAQISRLKKQIQQVEKQWQPRIDSLNTEYFLLIQIKSQKQQSISEMQKTINTHKNRILGMREQAKILEDRARVANIIISPQKRQQINKIYETQKQKLQFFEQFRHRPNNQSVKLPVRQQHSKNSLKQSRKNSLKYSRQQSPSLIRTQSTKLLQANLQKPEQKSHQVKEILPLKAQQSPVKKIKEVASIAVGTTFYYKQEQD